MRRFERLGGAPRPPSAPDSLLEIELAGRPGDPDRFALRRPHRLRPALSDATAGRTRTPEREVARSAERLARLRFVSEGFRHLGQALSTSILHVCWIGLPGGWLEPGEPRWIRRPKRQAIRADYDPVVLQGVIKTADEITGEWLGSVLGPDGLELAGVEAIGAGQMSRVYRVSYRRPGGEPESVAVKLASTDQNSREVGVSMGASHQRSPTVC